MLIETVFSCYLLVFEWDLQSGLVGYVFIVLGNGKKWIVFNTLNRISELFSQFQPLFILP